MENKQSKVLIVVSGGVVQAVYTDNEDIKIDLLDWDNEEVEHSEKPVEELDKRTIGLKIVF